MQGRDPRKGFYQQTPLQVPLKAEFPVKAFQPMLFLSGANSSTVEPLSKENMLKSMPLKMTSPEKMLSANRDGQSKATQEANSSCQAACHNTRPQFFPSKILLTLLDPAGCCLLVEAALQKRGAGCALLYLFSLEKGRATPRLTPLPHSKHIPTQRGLDAPRGLCRWSPGAGFALSAAAVIMEPKQADKQGAE